MSTRRQPLIAATGAVAVSAQPGRHLARALTQARPTSDEVVAALKLPKIAITQIGLGYMPIISPGKTTWSEFDFAPGFYLALCFIADPATGMPHVMSGMHQAFTVA